MPIQNQPVNFQFINTTTPNSYNANTIYFDNLEKNLKVGDTIIADQSHYLQLTLNPSAENRIQGILDGVSFDRISIYEILELRRKYKSIKIEFLYWEDSVDLILQLTETYGLFLIFSMTDDNLGNYTIKILDRTVEINGEYITEAYAEILNSTEQTQNLTITIFDDDIITHTYNSQPQTMSLFSLNGKNWSAWKDALNYPNKYNLKIIWKPNNVQYDIHIPFYHLEPTYVISNYIIDNYSSNFIFSIPITGSKAANTNIKNDILEIIIDPYVPEIKALLRSDFNLVYKMPDIFPQTSATALTPVYNYNWEDIVDHRNNLNVILINDTNNEAFIKTNNYSIDSLTNTTPIVSFGPIIKGTDLYSIEFIGAGITATPDCLLAKIQI